MTDHGLSSWWNPSGSLTEEEIRRRRGAEKGGRFYFGLIRNDPEVGPAHVFQAPLPEGQLVLGEEPLLERPINDGVKDFGIAELAREVRERVPTAGRVAAEVGTGLAIDLLSVALPFLGTAAAGLKGLAELQRQQLEWTAVLLSLREKATRPLRSGE